MRTNIVLFGLIIFVVSVIITLNIFFQQSYQGEMAEQFSREKQLIARSVAKSISDEIEHLEDETIRFARLLSARGLEKRGIDIFVKDTFSEIDEDEGIVLKIFDNSGSVLFNSSGMKSDADDEEHLELAKLVRPGEVQFHDMVEEGRKLVLMTPAAKKGGTAKGYIMIDIPLDSISRKFLEPIRTGSRGYAWMMNGNGTLLYHPTETSMVGKNIYRADKTCFDCHKSFDLEKKILGSDEKGFSSYIAPRGEDKIIAFARAKVSHMSWIICVSMPYSEVTFSIRKSMQLHSLLAISIFLTTLAFAFAVVSMNRQRIKAEEKAKHLETHQQLEKEILQTKDYLENILESTESKIMVLDREMKIKMINSAQERICAASKRDIVGQDFFKVFPMDRDKDLESMKNILVRCLNGLSHRISNYHFHEGDRTLFLNISINPLVIHGEIEGIILSSSDVTEEVKLKTKIQEYALRLEEMVVTRTDELRGEKEKLDAIVSAIEGGLCVFDKGKETAVWANRTIQDWIGKQEQDGITLSDIYGGDALYNAIVDNRLLREVLYREFGNRKGYFQITSTPIVAPAGHGRTLILIQDITEMKRMEERMMNSEKLSALARISAGVAHEIGNPLTSISSYVQILREMEHDEFTRESLDTIAKHINRIADIVRQMSSFTKTRASDLRHYDVDNLVNQTLDLVKYDKRMKHIRTSKDIPPGLPHVAADETQLIQVLMNIILNAADAMPSGGELNIQAKRMESEIEIAVTDSGSGIPTEYLEKIFDPFFTTKEMGTGLGLAVSYSIIKSYQGDILVENRPEGGTIFRIRLPYYES
ncbi:MAG: PAS domain-containing protein [Nitrospirae bacterium]|nr:PAS domain-containing protein [Nitrospirota bacterium]